MDGGARSLQQSYTHNSSDDDAQSLHQTRQHPTELEPIRSSISEELGTLHTNVSNEPESHRSYTSNEHVNNDGSSRIRLKGWRRMVAVMGGVSLLTFIANLALLIWSIKSPVSDEGPTQLFSGSCSTVEWLDLWVHFAINILSTILLGASNYCMQCLTAPTRQDVDIAHQSGRWLDIGLLSIRNLKTFSKKKVLLWLLLATASLPLHLLYNAAFYASYYNNEYQYFMVTQDFSSGAAFDITSIRSDTGTNLMPEFIDITPAQRLADPWVRLTAEECVEAYARFYLRDYRNLVVVTSNDTVSMRQNNTEMNNNIARCTNENCGALLGAQSATLGGYGYDWMCGGNPLWHSVQGLCFENVDVLKFQAAQGVWRTQDGYLVDHCIAESSDGVCTFQGNVAIIAVVAGLNLITAIAMFTIIWQLPRSLLLILGDTIASFLSESDPTTSGLCLLSKKDVTQRKLWPSKLSYEDMKHFTMFANLPGIRKFNAVNRSILWYAVCGSITTTVALLGIGLMAYAYFRRGSNSGYDPFSITMLSTFGFGTPNPLGVIDKWAIFSLPSASSQVIASLLIANLPQIVLSFLYVFVNRYLTNLHLVQEWNDFLVHRKGLRVTCSKPQAEQRSTYHLQLPLTHSLTFMAMMAVLHWLLSSSMFVAVVHDYDANGKVIPGVFASSYQLSRAGSGNGQDGDTQLRSVYASVGFSPIPIVALLALFGFFMICVIIASMFKLRSGMPVVGSCSAAIAAACHQPAWERGSEAKALLWGSVNDPEITALERYATTRHCCFSATEVDAVLNGGEYN